MKLYPSLFVPRLLEAPPPPLPPSVDLEALKLIITQWRSKGKVSFNVNHKVRPSSRVMISDFCNIPANYPQELGLWFDKQFRLCQS